jgi:biopolymer transport protein ExbB
MILFTLAAAPPIPAASAATSIESVWDFCVKGGIVMIPIALCSLVGLALVVERLLSVRRTKAIPPGFLEGLRPLVREGNQKRCLEHCRASKSPMARICEAGFKRWDRPIEQVEKAISDAGQTEIALMRKHMRALSVITSISPLLGLLGTIFGMIKAFQTVAASGEALGRTELLAAGIYEAMITTAAGLIVAIPALVMYNFIASRIDRLVLEMDAVCLELVEQHGTPVASSDPEPAPLRNGVHAPEPVTA